jgi:hypothetical protein
MDKVKIKALFDNNPDTDRLILTSDGQAFARKNDASFHASSLSDKSTTTVFRADYVNASASPDAPDGKSDDGNTGKSDEVKVKLSAEDRIAKINACTTAEEVNALLVDEKAKTVLAAGEEKLESFK